MAKQVINVGTAAGDGSGDPLRDAMIKINANFTELYEGIVVQTIVGENGTTLVDISTNSVNANALTGTVPTGVATWANLGGKPTSVAGFGIADAYTIAQTDAQIASEIDDLKISLAADGGDLKGSVFADDSTLLVDGVNGKITGEVTGTISSTNWMASSDSYLTIANGGATGPGPIQIVASANLDLTSGNNNDINITPHGTGRVKVSDTAFGIVEASNFMGHADQFMYLSSKTAGSESTHIALNSTSGVQTELYGAVDFVSGGSVDFTGSTVTGLNVTGDATVSGNLTAGTGTVGGLTFAGTQIASDDSTQISFQDNIEIAGGPVISGSSLTHTGTFTINPYALNLTTTGGNVHVQASNYVILDSTNNGQINIGLASGIGDVLIGNESNGTSVQLNGRTMFTAGMEESYNSLTGQSGVVAHDCEDGHMFYHTSTAGDITANFTNLGLAVGHATNLTIVIDQGGTAHEITAVQIGGVAQTIVWQGNSVPTGTANGVDSFSFTILRLSGSYVVLGQMVAFGGV